MYVITRIISKIMRFFPNKIQIAYLLALLCMIPVGFFIRHKYGPLKVDSSYKKNKTYAVIIGILLAIYVTLALIPYISFDNEKFNKNETVHYKDVEIKITDITYVDTFIKSFEEVLPRSGYTYMQITLDINNKSEENFYYGSGHWDIKGYDDATTLKKKVVYTCWSNVYDTYNTLAPNTSITQTLTYEVPLQLKEAELQYLSSIRHKTSTTVSIRNAPDFIILLDEE